MSENVKTAVVVGLGYVGLPLAVALAKTRPTWGLDIDRGRIDELGRGHDRTGEIEAERLAASSLELTSDPAACPAADFYIVTVPTLVDAAEAVHEYGVTLDPDALARQYDLVMLAVPHRAYLEGQLDVIASTVAPGGLLADLKNAFAGKSPAGAEMWTL